MMLIMMFLIFEQMEYRNKFLLHWTCEVTAVLIRQLY